MCAAFLNFTKLITGFFKNNRLVSSHAKITKIDIFTC